MPPRKKVDTGQTKSKTKDPIHPPTASSVPAASSAREHAPVSPSPPSSSNTTPSSSHRPSGLDTSHLFATKTFYYFPEAWNHAAMEDTKAAVEALGGIWLEAADNTDVEWKTPDRVVDFVVVPLNTQRKNNLISPQLCYVELLRRIHGEHVTYQYIKAVDYKWLKGCEAQAVELPAVRYWDLGRAVGWDNTYHRLELVLEQMMTFQGGEWVDRDAVFSHVEQQYSFRALQRQELIDFCIFHTKYLEAHCEPWRRTADTPRADRSVSTSESGQGSQELTEPFASDDNIARGDGDDHEMASDDDIAHDDGDNYEMADATNDPTTSIYLMAPLLVSASRYNIIGGALASVPYGDAILFLPKKGMGNGQKRLLRDRVTVLARRTIMSLRLHHYSFWECGVEFLRTLRDDEECTNVILKRKSIFLVRMYSESLKFEVDFVFDMRKKVVSVAHTMRKSEPEVESGAGDDIRKVVAMMLELAGVHVDKLLEGLDIQHQVYYIGSDMRANTLRWAQEAVSLRHILRCTASLKRTGTLNSAIVEERPSTPMSILQLREAAAAVLACLYENDTRRLL